MRTASSSAVKVLNVMVLLFITMDVLSRVWSAIEIYTQRKELLHSYKNVRSSRQHFDVKYYRYKAITSKIISIHCYDMV